MRVIRVNIILLFFLYFSLHCTLYAIKIDDIKIVNFTNVVSSDPFFVLEIYLGKGIEEKHEGEEHEHTPIFLEVSLDKNTKKYVLGDNILFERLSSDKIRTFVPSDFRLELGKDYTFGIKVSEGESILFSKNFNLKVGAIHNVPYLFTNTISNIYISKILTNSQRFFFFNNHPLEVSVVVNGKSITNLKTYEDPKFKNLYYFDYTFWNSGDYEFKLGEYKFNVGALFDVAPPTFTVLYPTNNAIFYRTNKICFKWSDPIDSIGVDKSNSFLKIYYKNNVLTNMNLSYLNRESLLMPYEIVYLDLNNEGSYNLEISYRDFDGNVTNVFVNFSIANASEDKEPPRISKILFEGGKIVSNVVILPSDRVLVNVEVDDGIYGSGVKKVVYKYKDNVCENLVFDNFAQFFIDVNEGGIFEIFAEDFAGNKSEITKFDLKTSKR